MIYFPPGNSVILDATFVDPVTGLPADPLVVRLRLRQAGQAAVAYVYGVDAQLTKISTGVYQFLLDPPPPAETTWLYRWEAERASGVDSAEQGDFQIGRSVV